MEGGVAGEHCLELLHTGRKGVELLGAAEILQQHICPVGSLGAVKAIIHGLYGADDEVHFAVVHLQPGLVALVIIVGLEAFDHLEQILAYAFFYGNIGRTLQQPFYPAYGFLICIVVPYGLQAAVVGTAHEGIRRTLVGVVPITEFLCSHIFGIETCTGRLLPETGKERLSGDAVPRAVVDSGIKLFGLILEGIQEGCSVAEILLPVYLVGGQAVKPEDLLAIVGNARQIRGRYLHQGIIIHQPAHIDLFLLTGNGGQGQDRTYNYQILHNWLQFLQI